ncbi:MAG: hypothetical protein II007_06990 [Gammaproteobacteria bacterium]|nr:hypothetical protein [Gammaproteobacteria bacterium]
MPDTNPVTAPLPSHAITAPAPSSAASTSVAEALTSSSHSNGNLLLPQGMRPLLSDPQLLEQLQALSRQQQVILAALARQPVAIQWQQGQVTIQPLNRLLPAIVLPRTQAEWLLPLLDPPAAPVPPSATTYRRPQALPELWPTEAAATTPRPLPANDGELARAAAALLQGRLLASLLLRWIPPAPISTGQPAAPGLLLAPDGAQVAVPAAVAAQLPSVAAPLRFDSSGDQLLLQPLPDDREPARPLSVPPQLLPGLHVSNRGQPQQLQLLATVGRDGQLQLLTLRPPATTIALEASADAGDVVPPPRAANEALARLLSRHLPASPLPTPPATNAQAPATPPEPVLPRLEPLLGQPLRLPLPTQLPREQPLLLTLRWEPDGSAQLRWQQVQPQPLSAEEQTDGDPQQQLRNALTISPNVQHLRLEPAQARQWASQLGLPLPPVEHDLQPADGDELKRLSEQASRQLWRQQLNPATALEQLSRQLASSEGKALSASLLDQLPQGAAIDTATIATTLQAGLQFNPLSNQPLTASPLLNQVAICLQLLLGGRILAGGERGGADALRGPRERLQQWLQAPELQLEREATTRTLSQLVSHQQLQQARTEETLQGLVLPFSLPLRDDDGPLRHIEGEARQQQDEQGRRGWQLRLRLPVGKEAVLAQARLFGVNLELLLLASSPALAATAGRLLPQLNRRLEEAGLTISASDCRLGTVPETLARCPHRLVEIAV